MAVKLRKIALKAAVMKKNETNTCAQRSMTPCLHMRAAQVVDELPLVPTVPPRTAKVHPQLTVRSKTCPCAARHYRRGVNCRILQKAFSRKANPTTRPSVGHNLSLDRTPLSPGRRGYGAARRRRSDAALRVEGALQRRRVPRHLSLGVPELPNGHERVGPAGAQS